MRLTQYSLLVFQSSQAFFESLTDLTMGPFNHIIISNPPVWENNFLKLRGGKTHEQN